MVGSLAVSVLPKGKDCFRNVLTSCQHTWQCDIWMSHCRVSTLGSAALSSVLTTCYCIPQELQSVLHQICSTKNPFDLRCESVTFTYCLFVQYLSMRFLNKLMDEHSIALSGKLFQLLMVLTVKKLACGL